MQTVTHYSCEIQTHVLNTRNIAWFGSKDCCFVMTAGPVCAGPLLEKHAGKAARSS